MGQRQLKRAGDIAIRKMLAREQRQKAARRVQEEKMLIAAAQHFREKGAETTLDDIAASVELTKPRLYRHFKNKREILTRCLDQALDKWGTAIQKIQKSRPPPSEAALRFIVEQYADIAFQDFGMCVIFSGLNSLGREEGQRIARQKAEVDAAFKSLLADAIPQEIPSQPDSEFLWLAVMSLVLGIAMLKEPKKQIKQEILSRALNLMLAGVDGEKS